MKIRKGDMVKVITGRESGKTGKVRSVCKKDGTVIVERVNFVKRHQKPTQQHRQGGIIEREAPIHISNVMYFDEKSSKASKLSAKFEGDIKKRVFKKTGDVIEVKV